MGLRLLVTALVVAALSGCGDVDVLQSASEPDAHRAIAALDRAGVAARFETLSGNRRGYRVRVAASQVARAVTALSDEEIPRRDEPGFTEAWGDRSLVTTHVEERARAAQAVAGELARTLETLDGVVDARVHVALPDDVDLAGDAAPRRPTAGVLVRYAGASPPCEEAQVRALVSAAVEGMRPDDVSVVFARRVPRGPRVTASWRSVGSIVVASESATRVEWLFGLLFVSVAALVVALTRLRAPRVTR